MMVDIFSSFDDNNQVFLSLYILNWLMALSVIGFFAHSKYWKVPQPWFIAGRGLQNILSASKTIPKISGQSIGMYTLIFLLSMLNLGGMVPYVFSVTSHLSLSLTLGFPLWLMVIISSLEHNYKGFVASFLPMGAPALLSPFLVIIEVVSILIRPLTLSIRLMANMSAGHIVLTIIGSYLMASPIMLSVAQMLYTIFEFAIAVIQAYIFSLLIRLYIEDHS